MTHTLIDIGANLTNRRFHRDTSEVIARALDARVTQMIVTGTGIGASRDAQHLAARYPGVLSSTAGVHPHHAADCDETTLPAIRDLARQNEIVAVGECGLDYNRNYSPPSDQRYWFEAQIELAAELQLPLFLHEREARADLFALLARHRDRIPRAVIHCFTGSAEDLSAYIELDLHIGVTGWICDERRGTHLRELVTHIPAHRLMLETDAPFLLPRDLPDPPRNKRNEPAFLPHVLKHVARCLSRSPADVAQETTATARAFFGLRDADS